MVTLQLVFIMATFETVGRKKVHLTITFSKIRLDIYIYNEVPDAAVK